MPQRILVLGASGYIGQHLVRTLSQQGHQILAAARHVDRLAKLQLANVSCHKVDLSWPDNLPALLQDIDTVYFQGIYPGGSQNAGLAHPATCHFPPANGTFNVITITDE